MYWPDVVIFSVFGAAVLAVLYKVFFDNFMRYPPVTDDRTLSEICDDLNAKHREQDRKRAVIQQMKYFVYDRVGDEIPVIFDQNLQHDQMAKAMGVDDKLISAGFLMITERGAKCYGVSTTLNMRARQKEDSHLINVMSGYED